MQYFVILNQNFPLKCLRKTNLICHSFTTQTKTYLGFLCDFGSKIGLDEDRNGLS